jgi:hypothetical protein
MELKITQTIGDTIEVEKSIMTVTISDYAVGLQQLLDYVAAVSADEYVSIMVVDPDTDCAIGDGKAYLPIPPKLNGYDLFYTHGQITGDNGTTGTMDIQIRNVTDSVDMLSTKLTIDSAEDSSDTAATSYVVNASNDGVASYDLLAIDIDAIHTTPAKGLIITLGFRNNV